MKYESRFPTNICILNYITLTWRKIDWGIKMYMGYNFERKLSKKINYNHSDLPT